MLYIFQAKSNDRISYINLLLVILLLLVRCFFPLPTPSPTPESDLHIVYSDTDYESHMSEFAAVSADLTHLGPQ